jgi:hypothetical protein
LSGFTIEKFEAWDPLQDSGGADPGIVISAQKREISNILKSYTGYYDVFAELIQNALDAVEKRLHTDDSIQGRVWVNIDLRAQSVEVTDNGCGMDLQQFRQFLKPNFSFKAGPGSRGSKGVGATYLGYGFNSLEISTRSNGTVYCGRIENGRNWVEDFTGTVSRPMIFPSLVSAGPFAGVDRGTAVTVRLTGNNIRPRDLSWNQATTATQWSALLRLLTPAGGIYLAGDATPPVQIDVTVVDRNGSRTENAIECPRYYYPHLIIGKSGNLDEFIKYQKRRMTKGNDPARVPARYRGLNGLWGEWGTEELLGDRTSDCPIQVRLDSEERALARSAGLRIYVYLAFSTDLWDNINDSQLRLRRGARVLHGGLQLATRHMPQGMTLTIPMTNNIGFQNLAHVIIHFDNAEPDLGRKGFQPEYVQVAEKIAVSAVTAFRRRYDLLRKPGVAKIFSDELKVEQWIRQQEQHEQDQPLSISGTGLFMPTEELPIRSEPLVEQDVVALFNQMLSSGLIRGIQLIASSQYNQYDGLFRVRMDPPFDKYVRGPENPLGIDEESFTKQESYVTKVKVLEYKYDLDGLVEELQGEVKSVNDIGLVVTWEMRQKWREMFDVTCLLDDDNSHHRQIHGTTHSFTHSVSGVHAFEAIILRDLVNFLIDPECEIARQRQALEEV